jgi:tRNA threonylcarbamoyl adenosine modification protein (Sua5/YciO/YrdC/YwlC family)
MLLHIHPDNPNPRHIKTVIECLLDGGVIIYPTDTIYGLGCDIFQHKAIERIARIKNVDPAKAQLSFVCYDLSDLSKYTKSISTPLYRLLKNYLPGPYTFILPASKEVPKILHSKKSTIGLRVPDNNIARTIVQDLNHPLLSASLPGEMVEEYTDPELMHDNFEKLVDIVIDGGIGGMVPSTVVDCTQDSYEVIRQGAGESGWRIFFNIVKNQGHIVLMPCISYHYVFQKNLHNRELIIIQLRISQTKLQFIYIRNRIKQAQLSSVQYYNSCGDICISHVSQ